jgi:FkbM family methyltransferase
MNSELHRTVKKVYRFMNKIGTVNSQRVAPVCRTVEQGPLKGHRFFLPAQGEGWADRIVAGKYETDLVLIFQKLAKQGGVLYDIGAHIGFFSSAWILFGGDAVEAFEPVPSNRTVLLETISENNLLDKVRIHKFALGDFNGESTLLVNEATLGTTSMAFVKGIGGIDAESNSWQYQGAKPISVAIRRLDDCFKEMTLHRPAILKLDVEGAEDNVLAGAEMLLTKYKPTVLCEVHNITSGMRITQQLAELGYKMQSVGANVERPVCMWIPN